jgi:hypothetical protein
MAKSSAQTRRLIAVGMLVELFLPKDGEYKLVTSDRELIASNIEKLAQLGRTDRWKRSIRNWAGAVRQTENDRDLRWAFLQYLVYVNYQI